MICNLDFSDQMGPALPQPSPEIDFNHFFALPLLSAWILRYPDTCYLLIGSNRVGERIFVNSIATHGHRNAQSNLSSHEWCRIIVVLIVLIPLSSTQPHAFLPHTVKFIAKSWQTVIESFWTFDHSMFLEFLKYAGCARHLPFSDHLVILINHVSYSLLNPVAPDTTA
jgi:hypothetical protein